MFIVEDDMVMVRAIKLTVTAVITTVKVIKAQYQ